MGSVLLQTATEHLDALYRYALTLAGNRPDAEDLVQEAIVRAGRASSKLRPGSNLRSWLFTVLRNTWLTQVRSSHGNLSISETAMAGDAVEFGDREATNSISTYSSQIRCADVWAIVDQLAPAYREIIVLREFEDLSYSELAEILGISAGTVISRLGRAREQLREHLKHRLPVVGAQELAH